jgi:poly-gamma-glutamate synthesis protein (capsule biosynthesis protein)
LAVQPEIVDALAGAGYDLCSTASDHSLDDGIDGVARTS